MNAENIKKALLDLLDTASDGISPPEVGYPLCAMLGGVAALELQGVIPAGSYKKAKVVAEQMAANNGVNLTAFNRAFSKIDAQL